MSGFRLVPFDPEHVRMMEVASEPWLGTGDELVRYAQAGRMGPAWTGIADEGPVGCAGVRILWKGTGEAWALFTPLLWKYRFSVQKAVLRYLDSIEREYGLERIQAQVDESHPRALEWAHSLGFEEEGLMMYYFNGRHYWMVSRL